MASAKQNRILGQHFLPFCAGIACGIFISIFLFLLFASPAIFNQIWHKSSGKSLAAGYSAVEQKYNPFNQNEMVVRERKLSQDTSLNEQDVNRTKTIPIDAEPAPVPIENPEWEINLTPVHIPGFLSQELKLKKKVFVAVLNPSTATSPMVEVVQKTWVKDWVAKGHGDITIYTPVGTTVGSSAGINVFHLSVSSPNAPSAAMLYQTLSDICSQHIDSHHHFFVVDSHTYVSLPRLLNFTNRLDDSAATWIGNKVESKNDRQYTNDPQFYCSVGPGFVLTRRALQGICPHLTTCQLDYNNGNSETGMNFARCALRYLNKTCAYTMKNLFHKASSKELTDPYANECPYKDSISVHPVEDETSMVKLHHFFLAQQLNETKKMNEYYHNIIQNMDRVLVQEGGMADDRLILGRHGNANRYQHGDVISWDRIEAGEGTSNKIYMVGDSDPSRDFTIADENVLSKVKFVALKQIQNEYGTSDGLTIGETFRRVVPGVGYQYMVDIKKRNEEIATICVDQPYGRMQALTTQFAPDVKVNFVLPLQDGSPHFKEFMQMFEQACMSVERAKNVALLVVLYLAPNNETKPFNEHNSESLNLLNLYKQKYPDLSLRWINGGSKPFSHIEGTSMAVHALPADTLICTTNLFTQMSPEFLHHARLNTIPGERLFFPAAFQELQSTATNDHKISKSSGFWRSFDYSLFCGYKQDIIRACGGEIFASGADLYERALASGLDVFRAPEHSVSIKWHEMNCRGNSLSREEQTSCEELSKNVNVAASAVLH